MSAPSAGVAAPAAPAPAPPAGKSAPAEPKSFVRRDKLRSVEKAMQEEWAAERAFEADAPDPATWAGGAKPPKFMCTFPYPYMNGRLHLGHAFTVTKAEFAAVYQRMRGKRVLFPFAFHCTGMPIQAAANRLRRELEAGVHLAPALAAGADVAAGVELEAETDGGGETGAGGDAAEATDADAADATVAATPGKAEKELGKFKGKKTKAAAKTVRGGDGGSPGRRAAAS